MVRYIDAEPMLREAIEERKFVFAMEDAKRNEIIFKTVYKDLYEFIEAQPTVDVVEVKHGEWVEYPSDAYMKCSVCGMEYAKEKMPNIVGYCPNPNCGAKMDGGKAE